MPLGEIVSGIALVAGFWTPLFAFLAFFMALNFHVASGALFKYSFLTNGYGCRCWDRRWRSPLAAVRRIRS